MGVIVGSGTQRKLYHLEVDALGSPRAVIDPQRNVAARRWDPLGEAFGCDYPEDILSEDVERQAPRRGDPR